MSSIINLKNKPITTRTVVIEPILHNVHVRQENFTILGTGKSGGGKSAALIELLSKCDPTFDASRIVFNAKEFIDLIRNQNLKDGAAILFDEVGESMGARTFMAKQQRDLLIYMQNYRIKRLIVGFSVPHGSFADIQLRRMAHAYLEFVSKKRSKMRTYWKYKLNQFQDNQYGQPIFHYPVVRMKDGKRKRISRVSFKFPNKKIWDEYLPKKNANIDHLEQKMLASKEVKEALRSESREEVIAALLKEVESNPKKYIRMKSGERYVDRDLSHGWLKRNFGYGRPNASEVRKEVDLILNKKNT